MASPDLISKDTSLWVEVDGKVAEPIHIRFAPNQEVLDRLLVSGNAPCCLLGADLLAEVHVNCEAYRCPLFPGTLFVGR